MLCREIMVVCIEIRKKTRDILCGRNVGFVDVNLVASVINTGPKERLVEIRENGGLLFLN